MLWLIIIIVFVFLYRLLVRILYKRRNDFSISIPWIWQNLLVKIVDYHYCISERKLLSSLIGVYATVFGLPSFAIKISALSSERYVGLGNIAFSIDGADIYALSGFALLCTVFIVFVCKKNNNIETTELRESILIERLNDQARLQLQKNMISGKYIPDTFLEVSEVKEWMRCFGDPCIFYGRIREKLVKLNLDYYQRRSQRNGKLAVSIDVNSFPSENSNLEQTIESARASKSYLEKIQMGFPSDRNDDYLARRKIKKVGEELPFILSQFCIIRADAGQGKTNFLCDYVDNVLIKRHIPCVFLNAFELRSDSLENSIAHAIYPIENIAFGRLIQAINNYCKKLEKPFILIIDGLNEHTDPKAIYDGLSIFLNEIKRYSFIRVVMSCRNEFYDNHFSGLNEIIGQENMVVVKNMYSRLSGGQKTDLIVRYKSHFHIKANLSVEVKKELTDNLLLLRIFAEAFENRNLGDVRSLHYDEMYQSYYSKMTRVAIEALSRDGLSVSESQIRLFFSVILKTMIESNQFMAIPIDSIEALIDSNTHHLFARFLDDNILLRKDEEIDSTPFGVKSTVSFTYDNFRDFMLADYLMNVIAKEDLNKFDSLVASYTAKGNTLREGICSFFYLLSKKSGNEDYFNVIRKYEWYDDIFANYVWQIGDSLVNEQDVNDVVRLMKLYPKIIIPRLVYYQIWDTSVHTNLNIEILLKYLRTLDDNGLESTLLQSWHRSSKKRQLYQENENENEEYLAGLIKKLVEIKGWERNSEIHRVMEFALYYACVSLKMRDVYRAYQKVYPNMDQLNKVFFECNSQKLKRYIGTF